MCIGIESRTKYGKAGCGPDGAARRDAARLGLVWARSGLAGVAVKVWHGVVGLGAVESG